MSTPVTIEASRAMGADLLRSEGARAANRTLASTPPDNLAAAIASDINTVLNQALSAIQDPRRAMTAGPTHLAYLAGYFQQLAFAMQAVAATGVRFSTDAYGDCLSVQLPRYPAPANQPAAAAMGKELQQ